MNKKAQLVVLDLIGSVVIFVILLIGIITFWHIYSLRFNANIENQNTAFIATKITDLLVETQGIPNNWNGTNVEVIGLIKTDRVLDPKRLNSFRNLTYSEIQSLFNVESLDFYFRVVDLNGALISTNNQFMEVGSAPPIDQDAIIKIRRFVLFGTQKVVVELSMWK